MAFLRAAWPFVQLALGFSLVIFVHEMGHFLAAKWAKVKVDQFAIGFGQALVSFRKGLGWRFGSSHTEMTKRIDAYLLERGTITRSALPDKQYDREPTDSERDAAGRALGISETEYRLNWLPLGGYVKMMGQEDFVVDKSGELKVKEDNNSFTNKSIGQRMVIVSAGVVMNLIFAAIAFTIIMMVGIETPPAVIGPIMPDSPASRAGLQTGDRITAINGDEIKSYTDLMNAVVLSGSGEELTLDVLRDGKMVEPRPRLYPEYKTAASRRQIGILPGMSRRVRMVDFTKPEQLRADELHPKDEFHKLVLPGGEQKEFKDLGVFMRAIHSGRGAPVSVIVKRPKNPDAVTDEDLFRDKPIDSTEAEVKVSAMWTLLEETSGNVETKSLLGLVPRLTIYVPYKSFAAAGAEVGDVVRKIGGVENPTRAEFEAAITESNGKGVALEVARMDAPNKGLPALVIRALVEHRSRLVRSALSDHKKAIEETTSVATAAGINEKERETLGAALAQLDDAAKLVHWLDEIDVHTLSPIEAKVPFALLKKNKPAIDAQVEHFDESQIVVAEVVTLIAGKPSPAHAAGIPAGAIITRVNDTPVSRWYELTEQFRRHSGEQVTIGYRVGAKAVETKLTVPDNITAALKLAEGTRITEIDGKTHATIQLGDERTVNAPLPDWRAVRQILKDSVGRTVKVNYVTADAVKGSGEFAVTADNVDPWLSRVNYFALAAFSCVNLQERIVESNPINAAIAGFKRAYDSTVSVIQSLRHVVITREVGTENLSGPVGIVRMGGQVAESGWTNLLMFLGMISANLAVINFLPMPIVDGGLFLFLVLEKLRGEPVSIKTQIVTQLVGIALIATLFILVTYQDILNWIS